MAWHRALPDERIELSVWRIHRKIGMSGGLFTNQLLRELDRAVDEDAIERVRHKHADAYLSLAPEVTALPGAKNLLHKLDQLELPWAIATSGRMVTAMPNVEALGVDPAAAVVVTRD